LTSQKFLEHATHGLIAIQISIPPKTKSSQAAAFGYFKLLNFPLMTSNENEVLGIF